MHNPFTIGSMIQNPAEFVGRTAKLEFLLTRLRCGQTRLMTAYQSALQSLIRKEMMERDDDGYRLAVPLFGLWILRNQVD